MQTNTITETALKLLSEERYRVINVKGLIHRLDQKYEDYELIKAASAYMMLPIFVSSNFHDRDGNRVPKIWPFPATWFRPDPLDRKHELVKALQFGLAELERIIYQENNRIM